MEYIHTDGSIKTISEIKQQYSNTSFPSIGIDKALLNFGYNPIVDNGSPDNSDNTKVYVKDGVEQNSNKDWVYKWVLKDRHSDIEGGKTKAEQDKDYQALLDTYQKDFLRAERKPLLEEADWAINKLFDSGGDTSKWKTYRQALRDITKASDIYDVTWPTKPS